MQDADLLVQLAAIAGVFIGFGALISVRGTGASDPHELAYIRSIVSIVVWAAVVALAPVTLSRYGLAGHDLWLACSVLALVLVAGVWALNSRTPEMRQEYTASSREEAAIYTLLLVSLLVTPLLVILGAVPVQEPALYLTAVELGLLATAWTLLLLVFSQRGPQTGSDPGASAGVLTRDGSANIVATIS
jgi:hypothetical protein